MKIINNEENPVEKEILAEAIVRMSEGVQKLSKNGLNKKAIIILIQDQTKFSKREIESVIDAIGQLQRLYCVQGK